MILARTILAFLAFALAAPALHAHDQPDGTEILAMATRAAGGDGWANARSLMLEGDAVFWGPSGAAPRSSAARYVMYREFNPGRTAAHGAEGKVRIIASDEQGRTLFTVGYDGATTWTERGVTPPAETEAFWASNMGFGIIRHAGKPDFKAERVADNRLGNHRLYMVRLTDPTGGVTLFGIDQRSHAIRYMGFATPRGWHERHYDDFIRLRDPDWLQAREVTLYYNGVKANTVHWRKVQVNPWIDPKIFAYSGEGIQSR
jgi:hypothetical protein